MNPELILSLLSSWQFIAVCALLMILLPLIFYVSSLKPMKRKPPAVKIKPEARKKKEPKEKKESGGVEEEEVPVKDGK